MTKRVVVVATITPSIIERFVSSFVERTKHDDELHLVIVDASPDPSSNEEIAKLCMFWSVKLSSRLHLVRAPNKSLSGNWNTGVQAIRKFVDYICVINDDILFPPAWGGVDWLSRLIERMEIKNVDCISPQNHSPEHFPYEQFCERDYGTEDEETGMLGSCFIVKTAIFDRMFEMEQGKEPYPGLFDENYRFLWEDVDFLYRLRKCGFRALADHRVKLYHFFGQSVLRNPDHNQIYKNGLEYFLKKFNAPQSFHTVSNSTYYYVDQNGKATPFLP